MGIPFYLRVFVRKGGHEHANKIFERNLAFKTQSRELRGVCSNRTQLVQAAGGESLSAQWLDGRAIRLSADHYQQRSQTDALVEGDKRLVAHGHVGEVANGLQHPCIHTAPAEGETA